MNVDAAARLLQRYPSIPFVAYVPLSRAAVRAIAHLAKRGLEEVVLVDVDDNPTVLRDLVIRAGYTPLITTFLQMIGPELALLPAAISQSVEHLFHQPHRYTSAQDLALASGSTLSALYRSFRSARLCSPKRSLIAARVLRGYVYLTEAGFSVREAATKTGYRHTRIFADHTAIVFGIRPSQLRQGNPQTQVLDRVRCWLVIDDAATAQIESEPTDICRVLACES